MFHGFTRNGHHKTNTATLRIFHGTYNVVRCWCYWWTANFEWENTATVVNIKTAKPVYSIRPPKRQYWLPSRHVIRPVCNQLVCILANPVMLHRYSVQVSPHMPNLNICGYDDTYQIVNRLQGKITDVHLDRQAWYGIIFRVTIELTTVRLAIWDAIVVIMTSM